MKHEFDGRGRVVATATRDLAANDECSIAYFDLSTHVDIQDRQGLIRDQFLFVCGCERCLREGADRSE